jgi:hypothetical protein
MPNPASTPVTNTSCPRLPNQLKLDRLKLPCAFLLELRLIAG